MKTDKMTEYHIMISSLGHQSQMFNALLEQKSILTFVQIVIIEMIYTLEILVSLSNLYILRQTTSSNRLKHEMTSDLKTKARFRLFVLTHVISIILCSSKLSKVDFKLVPGVLFLADTLVYAFSQKKLEI